MRFADSENCENSFLINIKRPKLLQHQFNLERQNILLLSTRGTSTSAILSAQESKITKLSTFLDSLELSCNVWDETVLSGLEMLLRAVRTIKSPSKQHLLSKILKFKLKLLLSCPQPNASLVEECFDDCMNNCDFTLDSLEQYYGIHALLDSFIGVKILKLSYKLKLEQKIKMCTELFEKGNCENILKDLLRNVLHEIKSNSSLILGESMMFTLIELIGHVYKDDLNAFGEEMMIIYQSNRQEFLGNLKIFEKFIEMSRLAKVKESFGVITMFNSRIRSFLNRPEARKDEVILNCTRFVLEYYGLGIGCIGQFGDFLLKCPLKSLEDCGSQTRKLIYKLLRANLKITSRRVGDCKFIVADSIKYEFALDMLENCDSSKVDVGLFSIYADYSDEKYLNLLEIYLKRFTGDILLDYDDFMICFPEEEESEVIEPDLEDEFVDFLNVNILPIFVKKFKSVVNGESQGKFIKIFAVILGLLLSRGRVKWADLSGTIGFNAANSHCNSNARSNFCAIYTILLEMERENLISGSVRLTLRGVLNPQNCPELWMKSLLDFREYGQVQFFKEYYGNGSVVNRVDCLKRLNLPGKFLMESIFKFVDFKSPVSITWWIFLLQTSTFLIESCPELQGPLCAKYEKYLPSTDFRLIVDFYAISLQGITRIEDLKKRINKGNNLFVKHVIESEGDLKGFLDEIKLIESKNVLLKLIYEFLSVESPPVKDKKLFLIQLACVSIIRNQPLPLDDEFYKINYKKCDWTEIYRKLFLLTEISHRLPDKVDELFKFLCDICGIERYEHELRETTNSGTFEDFDIAAVSFNFAFKQFTILSTGITSFNCLTQLLRLILKITPNDFRLIEYIEMVRKAEGHSDEYFNITFVQ